ncbi:unnamed protein product [Ixodes pacificus]
MASLCLAASTQHFPASSENWTTTSPCPDISYLRGPRCSPRTTWPAGWRRTSPAPTSFCRSAGSSGTTKVARTGPCTRSPRYLSASGPACASAGGWPSSRSGSCLSSCC